MHIAEGVLSPAVLATGYALTAAGTALGLKKLDYDRLMTVAILAAAFFRRLQYSRSDPALAGLAHRTTGRQGRGTRGLQHDAGDGSVHRRCGRRLHRAAFRR